MRLRLPFAALPVGRLDVVSPLLGLVEPAALVQTASEFSQGIVQTVEVGAVYVGLVVYAPLVERVVVELAQEAAQVLVVVGFIQWSHYSVSFC